MKMENANIEIGIAIGHAPCRFIRQEREVFLGKARFSQNLIHRRHEVAGVKKLAIPGLRFCLRFRLVTFDGGRRPCKRIG